MKIAFTTEDLVHVNAHFGWARKIAIYEVTAESASLLKLVEFAGDLKEDGDEDKLAPKIEAIADCAMLYVSAIGGSGAARVVAASIHPVRVAEMETIDEIIAKLQIVFRGTPPPWLRKAMNKGKQRKRDFEVVHG